MSVFCDTMISLWSNRIIHAEAWLQSKITHTCVILEYNYLLILEAGEDERDCETRPIHSGVFVCKREIDIHTHKQVQQCYNKCHINWCQWVVISILLLMNKNVNVIHLLITEIQIYGYLSTICREQIYVDKQSKGNFKERQICQQKLGNIVFELHLSSYLQYFLQGTTLEYIFLQIFLLITT